MCDKIFVDNLSFRSITFILILPSLLETYSLFTLKFISTLLGFWSTFRIPTTILDEPFITDTELLL